MLPVAMTVLMVLLVTPADAFPKHSIQSWSITADGDRCRMRTKSGSGHVLSISSSIGLPRYHGFQIWREKRFMDLFKKDAWYRILEKNSISLSSESGELDINFTRYIFSDRIAISPDYEQSDDVGPHDLEGSVVRFQKHIWQRAGENSREIMEESERNFKLAQWVMGNDMLVVTDSASKTKLAEFDTRGGNEAYKLLERCISQA